jgi:hypothetical protein
MTAWLGAGDVETFNNFEPDAVSRRRRRPGRLSDQN